MAFKLPEPITVEGTTFTFERATHTHPFAEKLNGQNYDWADAAERQRPGIHHEQWYFKGTSREESRTSTRIGLCPHPALGVGFKIPDDWVPVLTKRVAKIKADVISNASYRQAMASIIHATALYLVAEALVEWSKEQSEVPHGCPVQLAQDTLDSIEAEANKPRQKSGSW